MCWFGVQNVLQIQSTVNRRTSSSWKTYKLTKQAYFVGCYVHGKEKSFFLLSSFYHDQTTSHITTALLTWLLWKCKTWRIRCLQSCWNINKKRERKQSLNKFRVHFQLWPEMSKEKWLWLCFELWAIFLLHQTTPEKKKVVHFSPSFFLLVFIGRELA